MARSKRTEPTKQEDLREQYIDQTGKAPPKDTKIEEESDGTVSAVSPADQSSGPENVNDTANLDAIPERVGVDPDVMDAVQPSQGIEDRLGVDPVGIDGGDMTSLDSPADAMADRAAQMDDMTTEVDEFMLEEVTAVGVGGLDGRNDAAGYGGTGATTPTEGTPDSADALGTVGDSLGEYFMDKLHDIQNDTSLSDSEREAKMDALSNDVQAVKDNPGSPDTDEAGGDPPAGAGGGGIEPPPDGADGEEGEGGGLLSKIIDTVVEAAGYDSENFWGDSGTDKPGGGMIGGQSLTGDEDGLDLAGPAATASQDEVEKAANDEIEGGDTTTTTDDDAADPPPADPPPQEDMAPESDPGAPLEGGWQAMIDEHVDQTSEANLGADINYGDQVQGAVADYVMVDTDQLTGQFEPDYVDGQSGDTEAAAAMLEAVDQSDEFMDI